MRSEWLIHLLLFTQLLFMVRSFEYGICHNNFEIRFTNISSTTSTLSLKSRAKNGYHFLTIATDLNNPNVGIFLTIFSFQFGSERAANFLIVNDQRNANISTLKTKRETGFYSYDIMQHNFIIPSKLNFQLEKLREKKLFLRYGANYNKRPFKRNGTFIFPEASESYISKGVQSYYRCSKSLESIEFIHPAAFSFSLLFLIFNFILTFGLTYFKPLRSHGFLPLFSSLALILRISFRSYQFASFEFQSTYWTSFLETIGSSLVLCYFFIFPLNLLRFIILIDLSRQKINVMKNGSKVKWQFKLLKYINNPFVNLCYTSPLYIILVLGTSLFFVIPPNDIGILITVLLFLLCCIFVVLLYFGCIMFDFVSTIWKIIYDLKVKNLKFTWKLPWHIILKLWNEDQNYFRVQSYIFIPFTVIIFIMHLSSFTSKPNSLATAVLGMIWEYSFLFTTSGYLNIVTIFNLCRKLVSKKVKKSDIDNLFDDKDLEKLFVDFAAMEYSSENVICFMDIRKFNELTEYKEKIELAHSMKSLYFNGMTSEFEVNIGGSTIKKFDQKLSDENLDDLFHDIEPQIRMNLSDTYSRFMMSFEYQDFLLNREFEKSIINQKKDGHEIVEKRSICCKWYSFDFKTL
eukprot:gene120-4366_t